jgi:hypothetical protein
MDKSLSILIGNRSINILGWRHASQSESAEISNSVFQLFEHRNKGKSCNELFAVVKSALVGKTAFLNSSKDLLKRLNAINIKANDVFAIETTPKQLIAFNTSRKELRNPQNLSLIRDLFIKSKQLCPNLVAELDDFSVIAMAPSDSVRLEKSVRGVSTSLIAIDDDELVNEIFRNASIESLEFNPEKLVLPLVAKKNLLKMQRELVLELRTPSVLETEMTLTSIADEKTKFQVSEGIKAWKLIAENGRKRDVNFVRKLLAVERNTIMTVGSSHIHGIKRAFEAHCLQLNSLSQFRQNQDSRNSAVMSSFYQHQFARPRFRWF